MVLFTSLSLESVYAQWPKHFLHMDVQEKALVFTNSHPPEREVEFSSNDVEAPLVQKKYFRRFSKMAAFGSLNSIYCSGVS